MFDMVRISTARWLVSACAAAMLAATAAPAAAQNEDALRAFFEGKRVTVKIDMPGTSDGVDVRVDTTRAIDFKQYGERLKSYGTSIRAGDSAVVTLVKVKKDLIEFQLSGGGFGTFGDDTNPSVSVRFVEKSSREKELEKKIKDETDSHRRREMQDELDSLRDRRERENRRIEAERRVAEERKRERIAEERLRGGSRFNLRYEDAVPAGLRPEGVMAALAEFVDFSNAGADVMEARPIVDAPPPPPSADAVLPRKGMTRDEAERAFGKPVDVSDRREGSMVVTTVVFVRGDQRISADFVDGILIRYSITSR
jgi:hypothetical protein